MKRKSKNILCGLGIGVTAIALCTTVYFGWFNNGAGQNGNAPDGGMMSADNGAMHGENMTSPGNSSDITPPDGNGNSNSTVPPEKPDGEDGSNSDSSTPPEKPDGENSDTGTPPEKPSGDNSMMPDAQGGQGAQKGDAQVASNSGGTNIFTSVIRYVLVVVEFLIGGLLVAYLIASKGNREIFKETFATGKRIAIFTLAVIVSTAALSAITILICNLVSTSNPVMKMEEASTGVSYMAANEITTSTTLANQSYDSSTANENALAIYGDATVNLSNSVITKTGDADNGDNTSFYGVNSGLIVRNGATANLSDLNINTDAAGANGVFCYGGSATTNNNSSDGSTVNISDSTITTNKDSSGGIMVTGGGAINATNLTVTTAGTSAAAIRSDRGGGTMVVDQGEYSTTGVGSPSIYSTADITVNNATLDSQASEGVVIEGKNSVALNGVKLTDNNTKLNGQSTTYKNIFLYQSMSGDADEGEAEFSAQNSDIITDNGDIFYITNTNAKITLNNNQFTNNDEDGNFLRIQADSWGESGKNGGSVSLYFDNQIASGNVVVDEISTLDWEMTNDSSFTGMINTENSAKSIDLTLDADSVLTLTADSYVNSLNNADTTNSNINLNGFTLYVNSTPLAS